ncbi:hypothetical protein SAY87_030450 [Trapa incisa]|uniref:VQ domain-containing protein n=1 Tax=Trapa incisa TaxID=236973 RepID=A0AAN7KIM0_9MYRT|nr:hypothetical protein SAY87_030450 [Trapa incisa]
MASVEDQWAQIQTTFFDPWFTDVAAIETPHMPLFFSNVDDNPFSSPPSLPFGQIKAAPTPDVTSGSASFDQEPAVKRPQHPIPVVPRGGRVSKRKSRASKQPQTTFITADAANFREMVQRVTGVGSVGSQATVVKPQPQRATMGLQLFRPVPVVATGGLMPTTDVSVWRQNPGGVPLVANPAAVADGGGVAASSLSSDLLASFPTLKSGKTM